jgi:hypothetical protein
MSYAIRHRDEYRRRATLRPPTTPNLAIAKVSKIDPMLVVDATLLQDLKQGSAVNLQDAIHRGIAIELATIPLYLYALYSIKPGRNLEIARLVQSVVKEEMMHLAIGCNLLNAIGGKPNLLDPEIRPKYPGPLPGGIAAQLRVSLAPFSLPLVHDTFMVIEEPEHRDRCLIPDPVSPPYPGGVTVGQFYEEFIQQLCQQSGSIFQNPRRCKCEVIPQLATGFASLRNLVIKDLDSAKKAIDIIIRQGEGTQSSPYDGEHELAHFYRFAEIYHGRKLIRNPDRAAHCPQYDYLGHRIKFDPRGVWPVVTNPNHDMYPVKLADLNRRFNCTYSKLLQRLNRVFGGYADELGPATLLMRSMRDQAQVMMSIEIVPGQTAGPTFEYISDCPDTRTPDCGRGNP